MSFECFPNVFPKPEIEIVNKILRLRRVIVDPRPIHLSLVVEIAVRRSPLRSVLVFFFDIDAGVANMQCSNLAGTLLVMSSNAYLALI